MKAACQAAIEYKMTNIITKGIIKLDFILKSHGKTIIFWIAARHHQELWGDVPEWKNPALDLEGVFCSDTARLRQAISSICSGQWFSAEVPVRKLHKGRRKGHWHHACPCEKVQRRETHRRGGALFISKQVYLTSSRFYLNILPGVFYWYDTFFFFSLNSNSQSK